MKFFYKYLKGINVDITFLIGSKTAQYCESLGIRVDFMPNDFSQEGFLKSFNQTNQKYYLRGIGETIVISSVIKIMKLLK